VAGPTNGARLPVVVNAIVHVNRTGCAWRYLPNDLPPWRTVYGYLAL
jgi:transposase